jgi:hypothetical protein
LALILLILEIETIHGAKRALKISWKMLKLLVKEEEAHQHI